MRVPDSSSPCFAIERHHLGGMRGLKAHMRGGRRGVQRGLRGRHGQHGRRGRGRGHGRGRGRGCGRGRHYHEQQQQVADDASIVHSIASTQADQQKEEQDHLTEEVKEDFLKKSEQAQPEEILSQEKIPEASPAAQPTPQTPTSIYSTELHALRTMGFVDDSRNHSALHRFRGDLSRACDWLLTH